MTDKDEVEIQSPLFPNETVWYWKNIRDNSPKPEPVWFSREEGNGHGWKPLRKGDCDAINQAADAGIREVSVQNGRAVVDLKNLFMSFSLYRKPSRRVKSAIWFEYKGATSKPPRTVPLSKVDEKKVEDLFQRAVTATQSINSKEAVKRILEEKVILEDDMYEVSVVASFSTLSLIKRPRNKFQAVISFETEKSLLRGYGPYFVEGEAEEVRLGPVRHLFFVIHGIGEAVWSRDDVNINSMVQEMEEVRTNIHKLQYEQWRKKCRRLKKLDSESIPDPPNRIEFIPIEWYEQIHSSSSMLKTTLLSSTLDTIPILRSIANDAVFDVLMYMTPDFCQKVLQHVTDQINELYRDFVKLHPGFEEYGKVSIIGHSLGSVIAWDLLCILQDNKSHPLSSNLELFDESSDTKDATWKSVEKIMQQFKLATVESTEPQSQFFPNDKGNGKFEKAAWGPRLTTRMTDKLAFTPSFTILLGSPLAMFLSLRGAYPAFQQLEMMLKSEYSLDMFDEKEDKTDEEESIDKLVPTNPFHLSSTTVINIFHPSDPVAYRIEPLLFPSEVDDDVYFPLPSYLTNKKGRNVVPKRGNACKTTWRAFRAVKSVFTPLKEDHLTSASVTATGKRLKKKPPSSFELGDIAQKIDEINPLTQTKAKKLKFEFALAGEMKRVDYQLQPGVVESEILSSAKAHQSYFHNYEFYQFLMQFGEENNSDN